MSQTYTGDTDKSGYTGSHSKSQFSTAAAHRTHSRHKPGLPHPFLLSAWQTQEVWHSTHITLFRFTSTHRATYCPSTSTAHHLSYTPDWIVPFYPSLIRGILWMLQLDAHWKHAALTSYNNESSWKSAHTLHPTNPPLWTWGLPIYEHIRLKVWQQIHMHPWFGEDTGTCSQQSASYGLWPFNPAPVAGAEPITCLTHPGPPSSWFSDTNLCPQIPVSVAGG